MKALMEKKTNQTASVQIVCFRIGPEEYGIDILKVQEILKLPTVTTLPKSKPYIMGVMDLRGKVIPIIDLSVRFGIADMKSSQSKRAIVVDISGRKVGLAIDSVSHVIKLNTAEVEPPPPVVKGISGKYIVGIAKLETGFVVILDISQIFSADEIKFISK
jgi:purine-binding chemotaxis protein CheW